MDLDTGPNLITTVIEVVSYEIWVYLAYIFLPIVYLTVFCKIRCSKV